MMPCMPRAPIGRRPYRRFRGKLLRELREARGLSQKELGSEISATRFAISKWETERDNPHPSTVQRICRFFEKPHDYFYDQAEQQAVEASVILGHLASFTRSAPIVVSAFHRILVFQTGGPKAPTWWRKQLGGHVSAAIPGISYIVIACISPEAVGPQLFSAIEAASEEFGDGVVDLHILEEHPQLGIDLMVVDGEHIVLALQATDSGPRQCCIHIENKYVAATLEEWLFRLLGRAVPYSEWKRACVSPP